MITLGLLSVVAVASTAIAGPGGPARKARKPKDAGKVARRLLGYLRTRRLALAAVLVLLLLSTASMLALSGVKNGGCSCWDCTGTA